MRIESDSHVFQLGYALSLTEAGFRADGGVIVKFYGRWYKGHANSIFCSTICSIKRISMSAYQRSQLYRIVDILES